MKLKMGIFCFSVLTFSFSTLCFANLDRGRWIFHLSDDAKQDYAFRVFTETRGTPMVSLQEISEKLNLSLNCQPETKECEVRSKIQKNYWARFYTFSKEVKGFWGQSKLSHPPSYLSEIVLVPIDFGDRVLRPLLTGKKPTLPEETKNIEDPSIQVVIDAGHGGNDWGANFVLNNKLYKEKDLSLDFAKDLQKSLDNMDIKTELIRNSDVYISLTERTQKIQKSKAKIFLSLHLNAHQSPPKSEKKALKGYEIYVLSLNSNDVGGRLSVARENQFIPKDLPDGADSALAELRATSNFESSLSWAKTVARSLKDSKWTPLGLNPIRTGPFYVLYGAPMPALLLELGFIDNSKDLEKLLSPEYRKKATWNLAEAIKLKIELEAKKGHNNKNEHSN